LDINKIPVNEKEITDTLGYRIKEIGLRKTSRFKDIYDTLYLSP
jgi:hypothetical protein